MKVVLRRRLTELVEVPVEPVRTNPVMYFDVTIDKENCGRIVMELFRDAVPQTVENFRSLCTGERGLLKYVWRMGTGTCPLHYKGIQFHRIIPNFVVQGGDILRQNGRGNESIFGYKFPNESFEGKAGKNLAGTLAMAHSGPNQHGSQFFFNLKTNTYLNGRYVVFGQVLKGIEVLHELNQLGTLCGVPRQRAWISECGQAGPVEVPSQDFDRQNWHSSPPPHYTSNVGPRP